MTPAHQLAAEVRAAVSDLPYAVVDESPAGFALQLDVVDARWWETFRRAGLQKTWRWNVALAGPGGYEVTDHEATLDWHAGVDPTTGGPAPGLRFEASGFSGRKIQLERKVVVGMGDDGRVGRVVDYSFDSREGRAIIDTAAQRLGLRPHGPLAGGSSARLALLLVGLVAGIVLLGGVGLAVVLILVL